MMDSVADIMTVNSMFLNYGPRKAIYLSMVYDSSEFLAGLLGSLFNLWFAKNDSFKLIAFMFMLTEIIALVVFIFFFD